MALSGELGARGRRRGSGAWNECGLGWAIMGKQGDTGELV